MRPVTIKHTVEIIDDRDLMDRVERWFLYADWLWVALLLLLIISLPGLVALNLIRFFS